jgi:carbamoyl-phosphate synthase large subunit
MAIGRTFPEALQKALRSLETGRQGLNADQGESDLLALDTADVLSRAANPAPDRIFVLAEALRRGVAPGLLNEITGIDPWFIDQMLQIVELRHELMAGKPDRDMLLAGKRFGYSDAQLAYLWQIHEDQVREHRETHGVRVTYSTVDTCAAEFEAETPYFYSTYEEESETPPPGDRTVVVLGSGPNRIGQGIEFDYCCVHASFALRDAGYESVMVNCNPETVSTDYDTSDRLYFEPLTAEDVLAVVSEERPEAVIVQLGGQTPLSLAGALQAEGIRIAGTQPDAIDAAEDRERFSAICREAGVPQPPHGTAKSLQEAQEVADDVGFPALVRPSYVLGGRAMRIVFSVDELSSYLRDLYGSTPGGEVDLYEAPLLIDRFLEGATEVDVDAVFDGDEMFIGGIMEHVEQAGVHSGDSACVVPPRTLTPSAIEHIERHTEALARALEVRGLINIQFAVKGDTVYVLEANPRASRTVPFISKATGVPLAKIATRVMMGATLADLRESGVLRKPNGLGHIAVKEAVLPWKRFPGEDTLLGPEMKATGEVMGIGGNVGAAYAKALLAAGHRVPRRGALFLSLADRDKPLGMEAGRLFAELGFRIFATHGTAGALVRQGIRATGVDKVGEGPYDPVRLIEDGQINLVINTPRGRRARGDGALIRKAATRHAVPCVTTIQGGLAVAESLAEESSVIEDVVSLQAHHLPPATVP